MVKRYTLGEEIFNAVTHGVGAALSFAALVLCIVQAAVGTGTAIAVISAVIYGVTLIVLYMSSTLYHALTNPTAKKVFRIFDHSSIFLLIAGTYTPILICGMAKRQPVAAWVTFGVIWGLVVLAATLTAIDLKKFKTFSMVCYIGIGWAVLPTLPQAIEALTVEGFGLVLGGGIIYTVGAVIFKIGQKKRYFHSVFHILTPLGSACHVLAILFFVLW